MSPASPPAKLITGYDYPNTPVRHPAPHAPPLPSYLPCARHPPDLFCHLPLAGLIRTARSPSGFISCDCSHNLPTTENNHTKSPFTRSRAHAAPRPSHTQEWEVGKVRSGCFPTSHSSEPSLHATPFRPSTAIVVAGDQPPRFHNLPDRATCRTSTWDRTVQLSCFARFRLIPPHDYLPRTIPANRTLTHRLFHRPAIAPISSSILFPRPLAALKV